jgi:hypothetical protein
MFYIFLNHNVLYISKAGILSEMSRKHSVSRLDFLKMVGTTGTAFMLLPLVPFGKALGSNVTTASKPVIIKRLDKVGPDGVAFLYPTKRNGFVWYMNHDEPFDSHFV